MIYIPIKVINFKNSIMRFLIMLILIINTNSKSVSQIVLTDSDDMLNWYLIDNILFSKKVKPVDTAYIFALSELREKNLNYLLVESEPQKVLIKDGKDDLFWILIANRQDYFLLCAAETLNDPCRCLDRFYLYIPDKNLLQKIKPWYAWPSLARKNLVKTLNSYSLETLNADDFETYCELITYLRK